MQIAAAGTLSLMLAASLGSTAAAEGPELEAEAAILVDADTGKIVYKENADTILPPASMTKIMTEYLVHEAVEEGEIAWEDEVPISDNVRSLSLATNLSNVPLRQDETYTVQELYEALAIYSANAATVALAEKISGSEADFVAEMNEKAGELGMEEYEFVNSSGLNNSSMQGQHPDGTDEDAENMMSARATALLSYHLLDEHPDVLETASIEEAYFKEGTEDEIFMENWNEMLPDGRHAYEGVDGLKTGYTSLAGNAFTGTAERGGQRFISVVMRTESRDARFEQTSSLLDYGFDNYAETEVLEAGYTPDEEVLPVTRGEEDEVSIATEESVEVMAHEDEIEAYEPSFTVDESLLNDDGELTAPIEEGQTIGYVTVSNTGEADDGYLREDMAEHKRVPVKTTESVEEAGWFSLTMRSIGGFFSGVWNSATEIVRSWF